MLLNLVQRAVSRGPPGYCRVLPHRAAPDEVFMPTLGTLGVCSLLMRRPSGVLICNSDRSTGPLVRLPAPGIGLVLAERGSRRAPPGQVRLPHLLRGRGPVIGDGGDQRAGLRGIIPSPFPFDNRAPACIMAALWGVSSVAWFPVALVQLALLRAKDPI